MAFPSQLQVALKEWAAVEAALAAGRQIVLLRKGGIYEAAGEFELDHWQFLIFPTWLHQMPAMLKDECRAEWQTVTAEPAQVRLSIAAEVTNIVLMPGRRAIDAISAEHIWTPALIDMRFNYRPENPLYLLIVRAYRLGAPAVLENTPAYAGCKSWVPLERMVATGMAQPVLSDAEYQARHDAILMKLGSNSAS